MNGFSNCCMYIEKNKKLCCSPTPYLASEKELASSALPSITSSGVSSSLWHLYTNSKENRDTVIHVQQTITYDTIYSREYMYR